MPATLTHKPAKHEARKRTFRYFDLMTQKLEVMQLNVTSPCWT